MSKGSRLNCAVIGVFVASVSGFVAWGQTKPSGSSDAQARFAQAVDWTSHNGVHAKLPPHVSTLLGLTQEEECLVMQSVQRSGTTVRGFDVSIADKNDVVLFLVDESTKNQILYLSSGRGRLRRLVLVEEGVGRVTRITEKERQAFKKEKEFWMDRLPPAPR